MNFGIIANFRRPDAKDTVLRAIKWCQKHGHRAILSEDIKPNVELEVESCPMKGLWKDSDIIISMGGDGTMLASVRALCEHARPILGINLGSLGFLTQLTPERMENALERVVGGDFLIEERLVLKTEMINEETLEYPYALNDVVIDNGEVSRVIHLSLYANDEYICSYTADGLIISTPTGSTAYSLAVGGPILTPHMQAMIVSPISPFSLTSRPLIFPPDYKLEVRLRSEHGSAMVTIDGQVATHFASSGRIRISRADHIVKFIRFEENSFYDILRNKLHWGKLPVVDYNKSDFKE
ncbi:putative inorganic polyphosphate/ATP-NAD kinase [Candidatus Zixiibacteriota bacterium]|nr:putative inorganic polyphosphate/ATP-NAD kinase [candidate division Zixibacteria bacterium]